MDVYFYLSSDVQYNVMVKVHCITGLPPINALQQDRGFHSSPTTRCESYECVIEAELYQKGMRLGLPVCCKYKQFSSSYCEFNDWIRFPVKISDITREAQLCFTIYSVSPFAHSDVSTSAITSYLNTYSTNHEDIIRLKGHVIGGVTLPLFEQRILRYGRVKLRVKEGEKGDGSIDSNTLFSKLNRQLTVKDQLEAVLTMKSMRKIPQVAWLDALTNRRLVKISSSQHIAVPQKQDASAGIYLYVDLPNLGYYVVYQEKKAKKKSSSKEGLAAGSNPNQLHDDIEWRLLSQFGVHDPEMKLTNPVSDKDTKLSKHLLYGTYDVRPSSAESKKLQEIIRSFHNLEDEENKNLLWRFRNYLVDDKHALTKFLRTVNQQNAEEVAIALDLIAIWTPIDVADALELLSGHFVHPEIRKFGVTVLKERASDADLELYIMQLVQAIRFENDAISSLSDLPRFLLDRSLQSDSFRLLNFLFWSVVVAAKAEQEDISRRYNYFLTKIEHESELKRNDYYEELQRQKWMIERLIELSLYVGNVKGRAEDKKKVLRAALSDKGKFENLQQFERSILMPLRPELRVSGIASEQCTVFKSAMCPFLLSFKIDRPEAGRQTMLLREESLSDSEVDGAAPSEYSLDSENGAGDHDEQDGAEMESKQNATVRKQNQVRSYRELIDLDRDEYYKVIWKNGDDLRQDQLIIQMITLMDSLLREVNLDLCLTPYPVLATGIDNGMLEFVPDSTAIAGILKQYDDNISTFFTSHAGKGGKLKRIVDTFVRSCAGYSVITFLLGVGDRHLDNLLITKSGRLFHIDFGFIYGDDPKPWPPPIKLNKQMIDAMGGYNSVQFKQFQKNMVSCYNELRKKAPLILNLLSLMGQGNMHEIEENVNFVYSKFRLDLNAEQASAYLLNLMEESVNALFTKVVDKIHDWATYWR